MYGGGIKWYEEMLGMTSERIRELGPVEHMRGLNEAFSERNDHVIFVRKVLDILDL